MRTRTVSAPGEYTCTASASSYASAVNVSVVSIVRWSRWYHTIQYLCNGLSVSNSFWVISAACSAVSRLMISSPEAAAYAAMCRRFTMRCS